MVVKSVCAVHRFILSPCGFAGQHSKLTLTTWSLRQVCPTVTTSQLTRNVSGGTKVFYTSYSFQLWLA